jgi:hypothetical protein
MVKKTAKSGGKAKVAAVAGGIAAAGAAAAYYLYGPEGKKHQKQVKAWAVTAKKEVAMGVKEMRALNEVAYKKLVGEVGDRYAKVKKLDKKDVEAFAKELHGHWQGVRREWDKAKVAAEKAAKVGATTAKKTVKKVTKKVK